MAPRLRAPLDTRGFLNDATLGVLPIQQRLALQGAHWALNRYVPDIPEPPLAAAVLPVLGSEWQAVEDLQDGDYAGAVFNGVLGATEAVPAGAAVRTVRTVRKVNEKLKYVRKAGSRPMTAKNVQKAYADAGFTGKKTGMEANHTFPVADIPREGLTGKQVRATVENWRNHPVFIQPTPIDIHRRLTGSWDGKPRFGPLARTWHNATDWAKAGVVGAAGYAVDKVEDLTRQPQPRQRKP